MSAAMGKMPPVRYSTTRLGGGVAPSGAAYPGGLDLTTPSLALQTGALRDCLNYECAQSGGYSRIDGYERYDGHAAPSAATYKLVQFTSFNSVPTVGQIATQAISGAVGAIIAVNNVASAYYIVVTNIFGVFDAANQVTVNDGSLTVTAANPQTVTTSLTIGNTIIGTATATTIGVSSLLNAQYLAAAADVYRAFIAAVPGSGAILGVVGMTFNGVDNVYAFRADPTGTTVNIYKSSATGWKIVTLYNTINFTNGSVTPMDGDILTQGGVTAAVQRVMWQSGSYGGATAAGVLVVLNPTGGAFAAGAATTSSGGVITLSGPSAPISLTPGGKFEFVKSNFAGQLVTRRIYGCDGVNKAFEFDGVTFAPITTGLSPDAPSHLTYHKNFLFISSGSSLLYCGAGTPFKWGAIDGGGQIATGDIITGMITMPGSPTTATLAVYMRTNTALLYGTSPTDFNFTILNTGNGAVSYSAQNLFDNFVFDDPGVVTLRSTLNFGNFQPNMLTKNIQPFIDQERSLLTSSTISRQKSQYRVFFSNGYGLWLTMVNQQYMGPAVVLFPNPVSCCDEGDTSSSVETTYFGSSDGLGYIYTLDKGTSFDGASIDAHITLAWDPIRTPRVLKRFRAASLEMQGTGYAALNFGYQLGYGTSNIGQPTGVNYTSGFSAAVWDSFTWDNFIWDGQTLLPTEIDMTGTAENVQVIISSTTNYIPSFTLNSVQYHYSLRRGLRV